MTIAATPVYMLKEMRARAAMRVVAARGNTEKGTRAAAADDVALVVARMAAAADDVALVVVRMAAAAVVSVPVALATAAAKRMRTEAKARTGSWIVDGMTPIALPMVLNTGGRG
jgi:magnesium-transporting ATPase (P-type)